jgi:hypothetical protein
MSKPGKSVKIISGCQTGWMVRCHFGPGNIDGMRAVKTPAILEQGIEVMVGIAPND